MEPFRGVVTGGGDYVGGVAGYVEGTVENCCNTGAVTSSNKYSSAGGVVGYVIGGTVENWLKDNKACITYSNPTDNGGKLAITHYRVLKTTDKYSLVELRLETGRKNQIRVHMADLGHPVCGDIKYGSTQNPLHRLGLHAFRLFLYHPATGQRMEFETPYPTAFTNLFNI